MLKAKIKYASQLRKFQNFFSRVQIERLSDKPDYVRMTIPFLFLVIRDVKINA